MVDLNAISRHQASFAGSIGHDSLAPFRIPRVQLNGISDPSRPPGGNTYGINKPIEPTDQAKGESRAGLTGSSGNPRYRMETHCIETRLHVKEDRMCLEQQME
jgi:hypothetical protein